MDNKPKKKLFAEMGFLEKSCKGAELVKEKIRVQQKFLKDRKTRWNVMDT